MEHLQKGMARKWERHYREFKTTISYALILFGVCFALPLLFFWPQKFSSDVFNSRLAFHLVMEVEDYLHCENDYTDFVIDEPETIEAIYSFYIFNVSNAADVFQRGYKPFITETGPFAYQKLTYKYDITFDPVNSAYVTYKEYTMLRHIVDRQACEKMYNQLEKSFSLTTDPCRNGACACKSHNERITVINPLFLKMQWKETPHEILARTAANVYETSKLLLETEFVQAIKYHLTANAYQEISLFRQQQQIGFILNAGVSYLHKNYDLTAIAAMMESSSGITTTCGLAKYSISDCPLGMYDSIQYAKQTYGNGLTGASVFPTLAPVLNSTLSISFLNMDFGLPRWGGLSWCLGFLSFNTQYGYTMLTKFDCRRIEADLTYGWAVAYFGNSQTLTENQLKRTKVMVKAVAYYLTKVINAYSSTLLSLNYYEFANTYEQVPCAPLGQKCVWQYGYMREFSGTNESISNSMAFSMINYAAKGAIYLNNFFYDGNQAATYNAYQYCTKVLNAVTPYDGCLGNLGRTATDARVNQPAGLWGTIYGAKYKVSGVDTASLFATYQAQPDAVHSRFTQFSCNVSSLIYEIYPGATDFHDQYVIGYINKYQDTKLNHNFTVGHWEEIGWAQWGSGSITQAVVGVRSIAQIKRDGFWVIGKANYINDYVEFSSWGVRMGYPFTWIYNVTEAKMLLYLLANPDSNGMAFRQHIVYQSTTYAGDGKHYINGVGALGDKTFAEEINTANFSCAGPNAHECHIINKIFTSSATGCSFIQNLFITCSNAIFFGNSWVTNCQSFETSMTSTTTGIQCNLKQVYGHDHPYNKTIGNVLSKMMYVTTVELKMMDGLWCQLYATCQFDNGGLFTNTVVKRLLFEGYTDPSILNYLNLKYAHNQIHFQCTSNQKVCGERSLKCDDEKLTMYLPSGKKQLFEFGRTRNDEFFAPFFEVAPNGDLLWRYSMDRGVARTSQLRAAKEATVRVPNPYWAAHPAWHTNDTAFNKYLQCQNRILFGPPYLFESCVDELSTGKLNVSTSLDILRFRGNKTVYHFSKPMAVEGGSTTNMQHPNFLWGGFLQYPYQYFSNPSEYFELKTLSLFDKIHALKLDFSQQSLELYAQQNIPLQYPLANVYPTGYIGNYSSIKPRTMSTRRFVEDVQTWNNLRQLGIPKDSYGMPYQIPPGMASLQRMVDFPLYVGTPHCYGNQLWGGTEYTHVEGYKPFFYADFSFSDYDPISGRSLRQALRQQVMIRVERGPLYSSIISSESRCISPTRQYSGGTGYGCFMYVPLYWTEDARVIHPDNFFRFYGHFYARPSRAAFLLYTGLGVGIFFVTAGTCLFLNERFHRQKFEQRVYVD